MLRDWPGRMANDAAVAAAAGVNCGGGCGQCFDKKLAVAVAVEAGDELQGVNSEESFVWTGGAWCLLGDWRPAFCAVLALADTERGGVANKERELG